MIHSEMTLDNPWQAVLFRWMRYNAVGGLGILVQTAVLASLVRIADLNYLVATAIAVELAILHNFGWHRKWTFADRHGVASASWRRSLVIWARFNCTTGGVSIAGNLLLMKAFVSGAGLGIVRANLATIAICSLVNFALANRFVFV